MTNNKAPFEPEIFYHVINHAVGFENLFRKKDNYRYFLEKYRHYTKDTWETYAFCLMPNHFHLLVRIKSISELISAGICQTPQDDIHKAVMQKFANFLTSYAKSFNKMFKRPGALFLDYTKRYKVDDEDYFINTINYIHRNPVHHGFCKDIADWQYSSYHICLSDKPTTLKREELLAWFYDKEDFIEFHKGTMGDLPDFEAH